MSSSDKNKQIHNTENMSKTKVGQMEERFLKSEEKKEHMKQRAGSEGENKQRHGGEKEREERETKREEREIEESRENVTELSEQREERCLIDSDIKNSLIRAKELLNEGIQKIENIADTILSKIETKGTNQDVKSSEENKQAEKIQENVENKNNNNNKKTQERVRNR